jgi:AGZA family xanthine/uracil permease-like MFS transporter
VVGVLFLLAMFFAPIAGVIPAQATAPALILVGFYMMSSVRDIAWDDAEEAIPAFMTMLVMPYTWSITNGIGAGFVTLVAIKLFKGHAAAVHPMLYIAAVAFVVYFVL